MTPRSRALISTALVLVALAGVAGLTLSGTSAAPPPAEIPVLPVQVATLQMGAGDAPRVDGTAPAFAATIHYDREAQLSFRLPGRIASYPVRIGDRLPRGGLIAALESTPYAAASARAVADLDRASRAATRYAALAQEGAAAGAQAADGAAAARAAEAAAQAARYDLQSTRLVMPFAGAVIARRGEVGEVAAAGQALVTVADTSSPLIVSAQVPLAVAQGLQVGQQASVALAAGPTLVAHVRRKAAAADVRSGLVQVDLELPSGAGAISGAAASVSFGDAPGSVTASAVGAIPAEAVLEAQGDRAWVYVIDSAGRARRKAITLHGFVDRMAQVAGLSADARIITKGAGFVTEGQRVEVTP